MNIQWKRQINTTTWQWTLDYPYLIWSNPEAWQQQRTIKQTQHSADTHPRPNGRHDTHYTNIGKIGKKLIQHSPAYIWWRLYMYINTVYFVLCKQTQLKRNQVLKYKLSNKASWIFLWFLIWVWLIFSDLKKQ